MTHSLAFSSTLASSTVFLKLIIEVYIFNKSMVTEVSIPLVVMFFLGIAGSLFLWRTSMREEEVERIDLKSPFTLGPALKFAAIFTAIIFFTTLASTHLGTGGIYLTSGLSGVVNLDAPTVSLANLAYKDITAQVATLGIVIAACVNTVSKVVIALLFGTREYLRLMALSFSFPTIGGLVYIVLSIMGFM